MSQSPGQSDGGAEGAGSPGSRSGSGGPVGRLSDMVAPARHVVLRDAFDRAALAKCAILAALMVALHARHIHWLTMKWHRDANWSHGFIIPLFSLYLLYSRRDELFAARRRVFLPGLALMLLMLAGTFLGIWPGRNYWISQLCMVGMLFGLVLYLSGPAVIRVTWLPILFLVFAMPIPDSLYLKVALPLQNLAAKGAVVILRLLQVTIWSTASNLTLISRSEVTRNLTVAEACSGMRLLMAFLALGVAMAYLDEKPLWQRAILVASAIPIAVACNVLRVSITCWMYYVDKVEFGQKFMHTFTGMLMLIPAFALLWVLGWILRAIVVEAEDAPGVAEEATG